MFKGCSAPGSSRPAPVQAHPRRPAPRSSSGRSADPVLPEAGSDGGRRSRPFDEGTPLDTTLPAPPEAARALEAARAAVGRPSTLEEAREGLDVARLYRQWG